MLFSTSFAAFLAFSFVAVDAASIMGPNHLEIRQATSPADQLYALQVAQSRSIIHAQQVAAAQAKRAEAVAANNAARASNYAAFLARRQATNLAIQRNRVANNPNLTPAQKTNAINAFIARQQTIANNSQQNQQAISNVNNNAVAVQGQALQAAANAQAVAASSQVNNAIIAQPPLSCGGKTCLNVINSGYASCSATATCQYNCYAGTTANINPNVNYVDCISTAADVNNCGSAGNVCSPSYNGIGSITCASGTCAIICPSGTTKRINSNGFTYCMA